MSDQKAQAIVDEALKSGSFKQRNMVAAVVGIVGSGKTWLISRLFRINPPDKYTSTGVAEKSFRGLMHRIANMDSWELLPQEKILEFLAPLIQAGLSTADIACQAMTFTKMEPSQPIPTTVAHPMLEKSYASQAMISLVQSVKSFKESFTVELLHMVDTGGQPEFIEVMPSLIHNSNFTVLVLNLAQSLDEYPPIAFHEDGTAFKRPLPSALTNRQVIHQFARTFQAKRPKQTGKPHSMITVIGTHRDCLKRKLPKILAAVNKELKSIFLPAMEDELIVYRSHDEILFPVNLLKPDYDDEKIFEQIRHKISDAHIVEEAEVPLSFFMFEQDAIKYAEQKKGKDRQVMILSFSECVEVGARLKMSSDVVRAALIYFHHHNIFLHFQHVLPDLVFLAPQVPLDFINAIVAFSYKVKSSALPGLKAKYVRFCNEGIITEEMLRDCKSLSDCFIPGIYESQHAIKLFRHIYTIAQLSNEEPLGLSQHSSPHPNRTGQESSSLREKEYLMMSLLADKKNIQKYLPSCSKVAPLVIYFSNDCVPNGCFGNVISCLISKFEWKVCRTEQGSPECLAHNIVTLSDPALPVTITVVTYVQHLQIHINLAKVKEEHFNEICSSIYTTIFSAIEIIFKVMRLEDIQVKPAFLCPCKCRPKFHAATVCHLSTASYLVCTKSESQVDCLQKKQQYWFQDVKKGAESALKGMPLHLHCSEPDSHGKVSNTLRSTPNLSMPISVDKTNSSPEKTSKLCRQRSLTQLHPSPHDKATLPKIFPSSPHLNDSTGTPTMRELLKFAGRYNIPEEIGIKYYEFGIHLLQDDRATIIPAIALEYHYQAQSINREILRRWIQGEGKQPVTWKTLVDTLKDTDMKTLAEYIEAIKL